MFIVIEHSQRICRFYKGYTKAVLSNMVLRIIPVSSCHFTVWRQSVHYLHNSWKWVITLLAFELSPLVSTLQEIWTEDSNDCTMSQLISLFFLRTKMPNLFIAVNYCKYVRLEWLRSGWFDKVGRPRCSLLSVCGTSLYRLCVNLRPQCGSGWWVCTEHYQALPLSYLCKKRCTLTILTT